MRNDGIVRQIDQTYTKDFLINEAIENASDYDSNGNRAVWIKQFFLKNKMFIFR